MGDGAENRYPLNIDCMQLKHMKHNLIVLCSPTVFIEDFDQFKEQCERERERVDDESEGIFQHLSDLSGTKIKITHCSFNIILKKQLLKVMKALRDNRRLCFESCLQIIQSRLCAGPNCSPVKISVILRLCNRYCVNCACKIYWRFKRV